MKFKERIRELRTQRGLTQQELADAIGYSLSVVNKWENGKREPNNKAVIALAKFFDESIEYILGLEDI